MYSCYGYSNNRANLNNAEFRLINDTQSKQTVKIMGRRLVRDAGSNGQRLEPYVNLYPTNTLDPQSSIAVDVTNFGVIDARVVTNRGWMGTYYKRILYYNDVTTDANKIIKVSDILSQGDEGTGSFEGYSLS